MSDDRITKQPAPNQDMLNEGGFEREDLSASRALYFLVGLAVVGLVIYFIVFGMYRFLDSYDKAHQPPVSPMATPEADTRAITHENTQTFPEPRLEENERTQLRQFIEDQDRKLATYDWVDKDKGAVRIPIDSAMELIVQRGLPVHPEGSTATQTSAPAKKQTPKAPTSKTAASGN
jgi:hypothetical protein